MAANENGGGSRRRRPQGTGGHSAHPTNPKERVSPVQQRRQQIAARRSGSAAKAPEIPKATDAPKAASTKKTAKRTEPVRREWVPQILTALKKLGQQIKRLFLRATEKARQPQETTEAMSPKMIKWGKVYTGLFVGVWSVVLVGRLFHIQVIEHDTYLALSAQQQYSSTTEEARRGNIYDATGAVLVRNEPVYTVVVDPKNTSEDVKDAAAEYISQVLEMDRETVYSALSLEKTEYKILAKRVSKPVAEALEKYAEEINSDKKTGKLKLTTEKANSREYPYGDFLASVLGFCGADGHGIYGLEKSYDDELSGENGRKITLTDAWRNEVDGGAMQEYEAKDGNSLILTIDVNLQEIAERYLENALADNNVQNRGCVIIMDVNDGSIKAMASKEDFDPNQPNVILSETRNAMVQALPEGSEERISLTGEMRETQWKNKAITELYYPGSVFKLITAAAVLDSGTLDPESVFSCPGYHKVQDITYHCAARAVHGEQAMKDGLQNSCNIYFIQAAQQMGIPTFCDYFNAFGLTEPTGIDLPGEAPRSLYYDSDTMSVINLSSASFGQAQEITPIQMVTAVAAVVNGGYLVTPHVVDRVVDSEGNTVRQVETTVRRQVISEEVSAQMRSMMEYVVGQGQNGFSGRNAYVAGYRIGGKSGTSEQLDEPLREDGDYQKVSSFMAALPIDDPEIIVFAMLDDPRGDNDYASVIAVPVVGNIISEAAPYLGLESDDSFVGGNCRVPYMLEKSWSLAQVDLNKLGLKHVLLGSAGKVIMQYPEAGTTVPTGSTIYLYTGATEHTMTTVPDVRGRDIAFASQMLRASNLNPMLANVGDGVVTEQSVAPGKQVPLGTVVKLTVPEPEPTPEPTPETPAEAQAAPAEE